MSRLTDLTRYKEAKQRIKHVEKHLIDIDYFVNSLYNNEIGFPRQMWRVIEECETMRIELLIQLDQYQYILNQPTKLITLKKKEIK